MAAIPWGTLLQVVWVSVAAGVGVSAIFSLVILASARASEHRRDGNGAAAVGFGVLAACMLALFCAGIALGLNVMLAKD